MPLKGAIQSITVRIPLFATVADVPEGDAVPKRWALVTDSPGAKGLKCLEQAAEDLSVAVEDFTVFSEGREGDFWVVSAGYELET